MVEFLTQHIEVAIVIFFVGFAVGFVVRAFWEAVHIAELNDEKVEESVRRWAEKREAELADTEGK